MVSVNVYCKCECVCARAVMPQTLKCHRSANCPKRPATHAHALLGDAWVSNGLQQPAQGPSFFQNISPGHWPCRGLFK